MQFASLGSGSRGNATLIRTDTTTIMVDLGFSTRETLRRLARLNCEASEIDAILVTHEHTDHIQGVSRFATKFDIPVWATAGTCRSEKLDSLNQVQIIDIHNPFAVGDIEIHPFPVPHDAAEPCQFVFKSRDKTNIKSLGLLTDTGSITPYIKKMLTGVDALLLEFNHDLEMLMNGSYSPVLKQRVSSQFGHLSNQQAVELIQSIDTSNLQSLVALHLSEKNNHEDYVYHALQSALPDAAGIIEIADQQEGLAWRRIKDMMEVD